MPDRLQDLQRQRTLAQQQVEWFDRQIAAISGQTPPPPTPPPAPVTEPGATADADEIISRYRDKSASVQSEVKRGCLLYFFTALALVGLAAMAFYFLRLGRHP